MINDFYGNLLIYFIVEIYICWCLYKSWKFWLIDLKYEKWSRWVIQSLFVQIGITIFGIGFPYLTIVVGWPFNKQLNK